VSTGCCRPIQFSLRTDKSETEEGTTLYQLLMSMPFAPSSNIGVAFKISFVSSRTSVVQEPIVNKLVLQPALYQSMFLIPSAFLKEEGTLLFEFTVNSTRTSFSDLHCLVNDQETGCVFKSSSVFPLISVGFNASILSSDQMFSPPFPLEAKQTSDGGIVVEFSSNVDMSSSSSDTASFSCLKLFVGISASSSCRWINRRVLYLFPNMEWNGLTKLVFKTGTITVPVLKSLQNTTATAVPEIDIGAPSVVSPGTSLYLDLTHSTNHYGRPWSRIEIEVYKNGNQTELYELSGNQLLNQFPVYIPNEMLRNTNFLFLVTMCNAMNLCSTRPHKVKVDKRSLGPFVRILGPSFRKNINPSTFVNIMASSPSDSQFSWKLTRNQLAVHGFSSNHVSQSFVNFIPYSLFPRTLYKLTSFGHEMNTPASKLSQYSQFITVKEMSLVATIEGGNYQVYEAGAQVILKGESSINGDLDISYYHGSDGGLSFEWQCFNEYPEVTSGCSLVMDSSVGLDHVSFHSSLRDANKTFGIMLKIFDTQGRMAVDQVKVHLIEPRSSPVMKFLGSVVQIRNRRRFAVEVHFPFHTARPGKVQWSLNNSLIDLSDSKISRTFSAQNISVSEETRKYYFDLALTPISAHSLLSFYSTLQLSFICSFGSSSTVISTTIPLNQAPQAGSLQINPKVGKSLKDIFQMKAMDWTDVDLPLFYEFKYHIQGFTSSLQMKSEQSFIFSYLTSPSLSNSNGSIVLDVYDALGAKNSITEQVTVSPSLDKTLTVSSLDFTVKARKSGSLFQMASFYQLPFSPELQYIGATVALLNLNRSAPTSKFYNSSKSFQDFVRDWDKVGKVVDSCRICSTDCQMREKLISLLFNVSKAAFVEENNIVQWINLLQNVVAPSSEIEAMIGTQGRKQGMKLLSYYVSQLLVMSSSFETIFDDVSTDVFRIIDSFYQSALREMSCSSGSTILVSDLTKEWKEEVTPIMKMIAMLGFNDFVPGMKDIPLFIREKTFLSSFRTNDISITNPLTVSLFDDTKITLATDSRNFSNFHLAAFSNAWGTREANQSSHPLMIGIQDSNRYCESRDNRSCFLKLEFKNIERVKYLLPRKQSHVIQCHYHQVKEVTVNCAGNFLDSDELTVRCSGNYEGMINVTCPHQRSFPVCMLLTSENQTATCSLKAFDETSTVCACPLNSVLNHENLEQGAGTDEVGRRLQMQSSTTVLKEINKQQAYFGFFEIAVMKGTEVVPPELAYIPYFREKDINPSEYPFFMMTIRSWLTIKNISVNNTILNQNVLSHTTNSVSSLGSMSVFTSELQLPQQQFVTGLVNDAVEENYPYVVDDIYYINSTLIRLNDNHYYALVVLIEMNVNVSEYCYYEEALTKIQEHIGERLINKTNIFESVDNGPAEKSEVGLTTGLITMTYTKLMRIFTIETNSTYCDAFVPTQQPTASPTTLPGQSGLNSNRNSLNAFSELASRPDVSIIFILMLIIFVILTLLYLVLSNRNKPLFDAFGVKSFMNSSSMLDSDSINDIPVTSASFYRKKAKVPTATSSFYYNSTGSPKKHLKSSFSSGGFVDQQQQQHQQQQVNFNSHPMDFYHDPMMLPPNYNHQMNPPPYGSYPGFPPIDRQNPMMMDPNFYPPTDYTPAETFPNGNDINDNNQEQQQPANQYFNYNPYTYNDYNWTTNNNNTNTNTNTNPMDNNNNINNNQPSNITREEMLKKYKPVFPAGFQLPEQQIRTPSTGKYDKHYIVPETSDATPFHSSPMTSRSNSVRKLKKKRSVKVDLFSNTSNNSFFANITTSDNINNLPPPPAPPVHTNRQSLVESYFMTNLENAPEESEEE
jgi:hypothetical protein